MSDRNVPSPSRWLPLVATVAIVAWLLRQVDVCELVASLAGLPAGPLAAACAVSLFFNLVVYTDRWRRTLLGLGIHAPLGELLRIHLGTGALRVVLPIHAGEFLNAPLVAARRGGTTATHVGAIAYLKYVNLIATLALGAVGWALVADADGAASVVRTIAAASAVLAVGSSLELGAVRRVLGRIAGSLSRRIEGAVVDLLRVYGELSAARKIGLIGYSVVFQLSEVVVCWVLLGALGVHPGFDHVLVVAPILILASSIPVTLAGVGVREALGLLLLASHGTQADLLAFGVVYSFVEYLLPLVVGIPWSPGVLRDLGATVTRSGPQTPDR